jgi:crotonobetainyl-CoA:carnitine CoA-transferase CaiB-like acyl-CoA transferase
MAESLLAGVRVVEAAGEPAQLAGRIRRDLGAEVVKLEPEQGDPLRRVGPFRGERRDADASLRFAAWNAGKQSVVCPADGSELARLLAGADVILDTPGWPGVPSLDPALAPDAVWVRITPFGLEGVRADWKATDLGSLAASGMLSRLDRDRPPVRVSEPLAYSNVAVDAVFAALAGLWSGRPQIADVSIQESMALAKMGSPTELGRSGEPPYASQRQAASSGVALREIWRCRDGFLQFGLRGGFARVPTFRFMARALEEAGLANEFWRKQDWTKFNQHKLDDAQKRALQEPLARFFESRSLLECYELAGDNALTLATVNSPREIYASSQLASRHFFQQLGDLDGFPAHFVIARSVDGEVETPAARSPAPSIGAGPAPSWSPRDARAVAPTGGGGAFEKTRIVEFGSGAAGPIASRFLVEQGATVVRVESRSRPEFLRMMAVAAGSPHGVEGDPIFNAFNVGKCSVALNLKHPDGVAVARRLVHWSDAVLENFSPKAMAGFGLDYDTLAGDTPGLVMVSTCINGQTGPHRGYPGFGPQGSALSGYTLLTGYPDRDPHSGTVTDFLAPTFAAVPLAAGLHYQRRTGRGVHLDLAQVEAALYTLTPWLLDHADNGHVRERTGNRIEQAVPHGVFACRGEDRWIALAAWSDADWSQLAAELGIEDPELRTLEARLARVDDVEQRVAHATRERDADELASRLQSQGIEAVPVASDRDLLEDVQYAARDHFQTLEHPVLGATPYERNGYRLSDAPGGYDAASPTLGQHNREVLCGLLGYSDSEFAKLEESGAVE